MDKAKVLFFLEDNAQEQIIPHIFQRIVFEKGIPRERLDVSVLYSRGGGSIGALKGFFADQKDHFQPSGIVLGSDGNCKGYAAKRKMIEKNLKGLGIPVAPILAIPDPHIERWYLLDHKALSKAVGESIADHAPDKKCDKGRYKSILKHAVESAGIISLQGGAEYGRDVAQSMNLYNACKEDAGLKYFTQQVKDWTAEQLR